MGRRTPALMGRMLTEGVRLVSPTPFPPEENKIGMGASSVRFSGDALTQYFLIMGSPKSGSAEVNK